jgi:hypothetical protein
MILVLGNNGNLDAMKLENFRIVDMSVKLVKRKLPFQMQKVPIEEVKIWFDPWLFRATDSKFFVMLQQIDVAQALGHLRR